MEARSVEILIAALNGAGVLVSAVGGTRFRAVTHLDVTATDIEQAGEILTRVLTRPRSS